MQTSIGKKMLRSVNRFAHCSLLSLRFPNSFQYIQLIHSLRTSVPWFARRYREVTKET